MMTIGSIDFRSGRFVGCFYFTTNKFLKVLFFKSKSIEGIKRNNQEVSIPMPATFLRKITKVSLFSFQDKQYLVVCGGNSRFSTYFFRLDNESLSPVETVTGEIEFGSVFGNYMYFSGKDGGLDIANFKNLSDWQKKRAVLALPRRGFFDRGELKLINIHHTEGHVVVFYEHNRPDDDGWLCEVGMIIIDDESPMVVSYRSEKPIFEVKYKALSDKPEVKLLLVEGRLVAFVSNKNKSLEVFSKSINMSLGYFNFAGKNKTFWLDRHNANPLLAPDADNHWESEATFNPAVIDIDGIIHMFYRAMGGDGVSRIGYARSEDGINFYKPHKYPVLQPGDEMLLEFENIPLEERRRIYPSGASSGGYEDPRSVAIEGKIYLTYTSFEGWGSIRMTLNTILLEDLVSGRWNWSGKRYLSRPNDVAKNWLIFPEKINGKFAILHALSPEIMIDYVDCFDEYNKKQNWIKSISGPVRGGRSGYWDNKMRGVGPPPIKTKLGWLVLYHAEDVVNDPNKYKFGAMVLDTNNPKKILYRLPSPLLSPEMHYENNWKPGVIYASGAVVKNGELLVYYGGGDRTVCLASCPLDELLQHMLDHKPYTLVRKKVLTW